MRGLRVEDGIERRFVTEEELAEMLAKFGPEAKETIMACAHSASVQMAEHYGLEFDPHSLEGEEQIRFWAEFIAIQHPTGDLPEIYYQRVKHGS